MTVAPLYHVAAAPPAPVAAADQATVVVKLPADARLYVDDKPADLTSSSRSFITPKLDAGRDYYYTVKAEATRNGEKVAASQRVLVRAGKVSEVNFGDLNNVVAAGAPAHITIKLPEKARLYVDEVLCPQTSSQRSFDTPNLAPGKAYSYMVRVEVVKDGQPRSDSRRIELRAGKKVTVDFGDMSTVASR